MAADAVRHRSACYDAFFTEALLSFVGDRACRPPGRDRSAARRAIADIVGFCCLRVSSDLLPSHDSSDGHDVITALAPLPHPRFFEVFQHRSSRIWGLASTYPTGDTTAGVRSRPQPRPAPTIRSSTQPLFGVFYSRPARSTAAPTSRRQQAVQLNDNINHEGGSVVPPGSTNLPGRRPALLATISTRRSISTSSKSVFAIWRAGKFWRRRSGYKPFTASSASRNGWSRAAPIKNPHLAYLLSAGIILGLFRPLLCRLHRAATGGAAGVWIPMAR